MTPPHPAPHLAPHQHGNNMSELMGAVRNTMDFVRMFGMIHLKTLKDVERVDSHSAEDLHLDLKYIDCHCPASESISTEEFGERVQMCPEIPPTSTDITMNSDEFSIVPLAFGIFNVGKRLNLCGLNKTTF